MGQKKRDYGLILSLGLIIAVGGYWIVKELPVEGIEYYVDLLGEKLVDLVPKEQEKEQVAQIYDDFKTKIREKKINPEDVEKIAASIINLYNTNDTLSLAEAEKLMHMAIIELPSPDTAPKMLTEPTNEDWEDLHERLITVHKLEERLKDQEIIVSRKPEREYRVDGNLNIIIDSKIRPELEKEGVLHGLEEEKRLIWMDNMDEQLDKSLERLELQLQVLSKNKELTLSRINEELLEQSEGREAIVILDSLNLLTIINWDSIEIQVRHELEHKRKEIQKAKASAQSRDYIDDKSE